VASYMRGVIVCVRTRGIIDGCESAMEYLRVFDNRSKILNINSGGWGTARDISHFL